VILALSIGANNCPNIYSVFSTFMVMGQWTRHIPRFAWNIVATGVYIAIAIPGYSNFEAVLENFMHFIGYWLTLYEGVALRLSILCSIEAFQDTTQKIMMIVTSYHPESPPCSRFAAVLYEW
jgi:hypothetical protein